MFGLVMAVFFAWSREKRADGGLGWLESARRSNFATLVSSHQDASEGPGPAATAATARTARTAGTAATAGSAPAASGRREENVDDDEHLAAYNAFLARINKPQDG
jgi:hypothetical protein